MKHSALGSPVSLPADIGVGQKESMSARVSLSSKTPTLILENADHLLEEMSCQEDSITLKVLPEVFEDAWKTFTSAAEILIVTAHSGCNNNGNRGLYKSGLSLLKVKNILIDDL